MYVFFMFLFDLPLGGPVLALPVSELPPGLEVHLPPDLHHLEVLVSRPEHVVHGPHHRLAAAELALPAADT